MTTAIAADDRGFFGHPRGLMICFATEMWERFSFYGMRGLLVIYLTQHFLFSDDKSSLIYGAYLALVYIMTIVGGTLADRYLGSRKAVTFGAILLVLGHLGMAFEGSGSRQIMTYEGSEYELTADGRGGDAPSIVVAGDAKSVVQYTTEGIVVVEPQAVGLPPLVPADAYETRIEREPLYVNILYLSLALIIAGVGYLKANISTIVGSLYEQGDRRRDAGFTIFYMGINLGSFAAGLACGWLAYEFGWKYGFGLAGLGMLAGLLVFLMGQPLLEGRGEPPNPEALKEPWLLGVNREIWCYLAAPLIMLVAFLLVSNAEFYGTPVGQNMVLAVGLLTFLFLVGFAIFTVQGEERSQLLAALYFIVAQIPFWALFEQAGSSLNLFADRIIDRDVFGFVVPTPWFQSLNAGFIILFAPVLAWLWVALGKRNLEPSTPVKFAFGVAGVGLGFLALAAGINGSGSTALVPVLFIVLIYWFHTIAELMLSPVGLSAITKLAPARVVGMAMGAWFLYIGFGGYLAGVIAKQTGAETLGGQITDIAAAKATYASVYTNVAWVSIGIAVVMLLISPIVKRYMRGVH